MLPLNPSPSNCSLAGASPLAGRNASALAVTQRAEFDARLKLPDAARRVQTTSPDGLVATSRTPRLSGQVAITSAASAFLERRGR